jgi:acetyl esterase
LLCGWRRQARLCRINRWASAQTPQRQKDDAEALRRFESPLLTREELAWFFDQYIPERSQRTDPRFAPACATSLANLPPAFVLTAQYDLPVEEGEQYVARLAQAGNRVKVESYLGTMHGFLTIDRGMLPHSGKAMNDVSAFLTEVL